MLLLSLLPGESLSMCCRSNGTTHRNMSLALAVSSMEWAGGAGAVMSDLSLADACSRRLPPGKFPFEW
jgi:hypothetical protein